VTSRDTYQKEYHNQAILYWENFLEQSIQGKELALAREEIGF
jgi:hypothetical protein